MNFKPNNTYISHSSFAAQQSEPDQHQLPTSPSVRDFAGPNDLPDVQLDHHHKNHQTARNFVLHCGYCALPIVSIDFGQD